MENSAYTKTYSVATGTDMFVMFNDYAVSTIQGISYSITRQKAPIYAMGKTDPVSIARSKRGIAGSMIMTAYDRHCLADFMTMNKFWAKSNSLETSAINPFQHSVYDELTATSRLTSGLSSSDIKKEISSKNAWNVFVTQKKQGAISEQVAPMYPDQLLPFDVTIISSNEYGTGSVMRIFGVEILNEGSGTSVDDTSNEVQMTYIARLVVPWTSTTQGSTYESVIGS